MADKLTAPLFSADGAEKGTVELNEAIFGIEPNIPVIHQVVTAQLAGKRRGTHSTKTRAEVRGGGRKPWRQKGLGRARHGSIRSPQWVGGGIAHGPKPRDYSQRTPKKMKRLALHSALSARASESAVKIVEDFSWDAPKTKTAAQLLGQIGWIRIRRILGPEHDRPEIGFRPDPGLVRIVPSQPLQPRTRGVVRPIELDRKRRARHGFGTNLQRQGIGFGL